MADKKNSFSRIVNSQYLFVNLPLQIQTIPLLTPPSNTFFNYFHTDLMAYIFDFPSLGRKALESLNSYINESISDLKFGAY